MTIDIAPTGAALGAEVRGVDLAAPLDDATFERIRRAFFDNEVLIFRDQRLRPNDQIAFARRFGDLKVLPFGRSPPGAPELYVISNIREKGEAIGDTDAGRFWHTDGAYLPSPHLASMLYALEVPEFAGKVLGDTLFASMTAAYRALPAETRARVEPLHAEHSLENRYERRSVRDASQNAEVLRTKAKHPPVVHRLARPHHATGRPALFVTEGYTSRIVELADQESDELISALCVHAVQPEFIYRHRWRKGDLVMWDNSSTVHRATFDYPPETRRLMHRATVAGV